MWQNWTVLPPLAQVRWADLEEQKEEHRRRLQMGFVLGSSWARVPEEQVTAILHGQRRVSSTSSDWEDCLIIEQVDFGCRFVSLWMFNMYCVFINGHSTCAENIDFWLDWHWATISTYQWMKQTIYICTVAKPCKCPPVTRCLCFFSLSAQKCMCNEQTRPVVVEVTTYTLTE